ncbi:MAG: ABC transporter permease [Pseudolabrys sp.]|nr:ABC transporter permease [Pseudolabrys sp.]
MISAVRKSLVLWKYRDRLFDNVISDVRSRYGGSVLGIAWVVIYPAMQLAIYACLYVFIFRVKPPSLSVSMYVILVFSGMIPLMAFNEALLSATSSLLTNRNLLLNTVFPAELIPVRSVLSAQCSSMVALTIALVAGAFYGNTDIKALVLVPFFWGALILFVTGIGWALSLISLVARDIQHGLSLVVMLIFVLSPFAYTPDMVPQGLKFIIYMNPLSYFVFCFQDLICYGRFPQVWHVAIVVTLAFATYIGGLTFFDRVKGVFFDYA